MKKSLVFAGLLIALLWSATGWAQGPPVSGGVKSVKGTGAVVCNPTTGNVVCNANGSGGFPAGATNTLQKNAGGGLFGAVPVVPNAVLSTDGSGVPTLSTTLPNGLNFGTPAVLSLLNATGLPLGSVTGLGAGMATFLAVPSSANLLSGLTTKTGIGLAVFNNGPTLIAPILGTPASVNLANATNLPLASVTGLGTLVPTALGNGVGTPGAFKLNSDPHSAPIGWPATANPNLIPVITVPVAGTVTSIEGRVMVAVGAVATVDVFKAASGVPCASGTKLNTTSFNANGTAGVNQVLGNASTTLAAHDTICLVTANGANFTAGTGVGGLTVNYTTP